MYLVGSVAVYEAFLIVLRVACALFALERLQGLSGRSCLKQYASIIQPASLKNSIEKNIADKTINKFSMACPHFLGCPAPCS